jgi:hypothetical protein
MEIDAMAGRSWKYLWGIFKIAASKWQPYESRELDRRHPEAEDSLRSRERME